MPDSVVITGAGSGIGRALAEQCVGRGDQVALWDIDGDKVERVAEELRARGGRVSTAVVDVRDAEAIAQYMAEVRAQTGRLDYVFNNAGIALSGEVRDTELGDWRTVLDIDLFGVVNGVAAAYPIMIEQGFGHIVNIASLAGLLPAPGMTAYSTAKHGVVGLSVSLRQEARAYGVKVSAVCPGFVDTPIKDNGLLRGVLRDKVREFMNKSGMPVGECARVILSGVARNRDVIVVGRSAQVMYCFYRASPWLYATVLGPVGRRVLATLQGRG